MKHDYGCFCELCMEHDRVKQLRKNLVEAERSLAVLCAAKKITPEMLARQIDAARSE